MKCVVPFVVEPWFCGCGCRGRGVDHGVDEFMYVNSGERKKASAAAGGEEGAGVVTAMATQPGGMVGAWRTEKMRRGR